MAKNKNNQVKNAAAANQQQFNAEFAEETAANNAARKAGANAAQKANK